MRNLIAASVTTCAMTCAMTVAALPVLAAQDEMVMTRSPHDVTTTMDRLEAAVTGAGAMVVARVDHAAAAQGADMVLAPNQVLIFGNPAIGTPAMQDNPLAGLFLPLRVVAYEDQDGQTWLVYHDPEEMLEDLDGVPDDAAYIAAMAGALAKLTAQAVAE